MTALPGHALAAVHAALDDLRREDVRDALWTDEYTSSLLFQVIALEEVLAARWPRSILLRARLRRELRTSVRHTIHGRSFAERRAETIASGWLERPAGKVRRAS